MNPYKPACFRISGIPCDWDHEKVKKILQTIDPELNLKDKDWEDAELSELFPSCGVDSSRQMALLDFNHPTTFFRKFAPKEQKKKVFTENGRKVRVVAVIGLAGHAYGSWKSRTLTVDRPMWLCDFLPERFPRSRIMTYGYDSSLTDPNQARLTDYRRNLLVCLKNARVKCPALVESNKSSEYSDILKYIRGVFFFGTPHQGLRTVELEIMVEDSTDTDLKLKVALGVYKRAGEAAQMVNRLSAQLNFPGEHRFPINSDHTGMVKFDSLDDDAYQTVVRCMEECIDKNDKEWILRSLLSTARLPTDIFRVDQTSYIEAHLEPCPDACNIENDGIYFWIFRNVMDYGQWSKLDKGPAKTLVLSGDNTSLLEDAASHIVNTLRSREGSDMLLYFFVGSTYGIQKPQSQHRARWKDISLVPTFLSQVIDKHLVERKELFKS
ncbi:hypothetical protein BDD12DRAFT_803703 [Trichophaea hybrida]|nr:hypothetical protein BDD12DRAFT_803703 [Trichophaea hybrida]